MTLPDPALRPGARLVAALVLLAASAGVAAQTHAAPKTAAKKTAPAKPAAKAPPALMTVEMPPPEDADAAQIEAAERVFRGIYDCEFKVVVTVAPSDKYPSYVDVKHGRSEYLMKPVLSSTGAIRLEDVRGEALMVQINAKSMLLNLRTGRRIADECTSPRQREIMEGKRLAKIADAAASAASAAAAQTAETPAQPPTAAAITTPAVAK